jgi:hypothetical protein
MIDKEFVLDIAKMVILAISFTAFAGIALLLVIKLLVFIYGVLF